jgi:hypothetical protein
MSNPNITPVWLDTDMAEQLRHSVEARLMLEAEEQQVWHLLSNIRKDLAGAHFCATNASSGLCFLPITAGIIPASPADCVLLHFCSTARACFSPAVSWQSHVSFILAEKLQLALAVR